MRPNFIIIPHRGYSDIRPENTLSAFEAAFTAGFPQFEFDVHLTRDGKVVVLHDDDIVRTSNGKGAVSTLTIDELQKYSFGSWFGAEYRQECIPTLQRIVQLYGRRAHLHIELKGEDPTLPMKVLATLQAEGMLRESNFDPWGIPGITITSFSLSLLRESKLLFPEAVTHGYLTKFLTQKKLNALLQIGIQQICPLAAFTSKRKVNQMHTMGFSVRAWGVKTALDLRMAYSAGVDGVTVNWPEKAREILSEV